MGRGRDPVVAVVVHDSFLLSGRQLELVEFRLRL
jgi:hypothetical protein